MADVEAPTAISGSAKVKSIVLSFQKNCVGLQKDYHGESLSIR